jgi:two-component system chemotaxis response regulator CheY
MNDNPKKRVLIADDDLAMRKLMAATMKSDFEVVGEAKNGQEAIDLYKKFKPDLLLLDINMPEKNGEDVLKELMPEFPNALIIMLSAHRELDSIEDCLNLGAANYIPKDKPRKEIKELIEETWKKFHKEA